MSKTHPGLSDSTADSHISALARIIGWNLNRAIRVVTEYCFALH